MPADMTFEEAAAVADGALTAMAFLRQAALQPNQRVLVYGATGSIGTAALQLAQHLGAEVTAACEAEHADLARSLGATTVLDYRLVDVTSGERRYHVILDAVGKLSAWRARRALVPAGVSFTAGSAGSLLPVLVLSLVTRGTRRRRVRLGVPQYRREDLVALQEPHRPVVRIGPSLTGRIRWRMSSSSPVRRHAPQDRQRRPRRPWRGRAMTPSWTRVTVKP